jgi:hypothetical protein
MIGAAVSALAIGLVLSPSVARGSDPGVSATVVVNLNGRKLADATRTAGPRGEEVLIPVAAIQRAVDGEAAVTSRLRVNGRNLAAASVGHCDDCPVRVARPVVVSADVRVVDGVALIPLGDLVKAFEGRLEVNAARTVYGIYAGKCTWCILEPR